MYIPLFILSLTAPRLSQFDAVHELTAILKFNIKLLTTSNAQHPWAFSFSRGQKGQIFHCSLGDFVKLTAVPSFFHVCISDAALLICWHNWTTKKIQLKSFKLYLIKFDLIIYTFQKYPPVLDKLKLSMVLDILADPGQAALHRPFVWSGQQFNAKFQEGGQFQDCIKL